MKTKAKYHFEIIQNTPEWTDIRKGRLGGSSANVLAVKGKSENGLGTGAIGKAYECAAALMYDEIGEAFVSPAMEHGTMYEPIAREAYEAETFNEVKECGYITYGTYAGYSPDGLIGENGLIEIKCRQGKAFLRYKHLRKKIGLKAIPKDAFCQMQWGMAVTGRAWCDYVNYHPQGGLLIDRVEADKDVMSSLLLRYSAYVKLLRDILAI